MSNGKSKGATKAAPAKATTQKVDLSGLAVEDAELPQMQREGKYGPNPFVDPLKDSFDNKRGKAVTVDGEEGAKAATYLLRQAATRLRIGVRIITEDAGNGKVRVMFQGKPKRQTKKDAAATG